jgi:hypothetical protein
LNVDERTVKKWANCDGHKDKPHTGRKTKLSPKTKRKIETEMRDVLGASTRKCTKILNSSEDYLSRDKTISRTTVKDYVRSTEWGKTAYKPLVKPLLSSKNISDRLSFALTMQMEGYCDPGPRGQSLRANILFTDESPIELHPEPNKQNTRIRTDDLSKIPIVSRPKKSLHIIVAGGICASGVTELYVMEANQTIDGKTYEEKILPIYLKAADDNTLFPNLKKVTFMQDGAPGHNYTPVINKLESRFDRLWTRGVWPGSSPDLNVIEHLWAELQDSVFIEPRPTNRQELIDRVQNKWKSFTKSQLRNLVESFPNRIKETINNEGKHTSY